MKECSDLAEVRKGYLLAKKNFKSSKALLDVARRRLDIIKPKYESYKNEEKKAINAW